MAELLVKVGPGASYEDGDVLCSFNNRRIRCVHAEQICKLDSFNNDGLRPAKSLAKELRHATHQYLFRRVSETTIERHNLLTGEVDTFGSESIDVRAFLERRLKHGKHAIFGTKGAEFWYGGQIDVSDSKLDIVWDAIESMTDRVRVEGEFQLWPMGRLDIRHHLAIRVEDLTDAGSESLVAPNYELDDNGDIVYELIETTQHKVLIQGESIPDKEPDVAKPDQVRDWKLARVVTQHDEIGTEIEVEWYWIATDREVLERKVGFQPDPEPTQDPNSTKKWEQKLLAKRKTQVNWKNLLEDIQVSEADVLDKETPIGRDIAIGQDKFRYESKEQPLQDIASKIETK